jgi:putative ABC transport system substrate-binding protein
VRKPDDIGTVASAFQARPQALIILPSPMTLAESPRLAMLAMKQRLPATSIFPLFAEAGGTVSYGPASGVERAALQVTKILRGTKPGDLPIERPTKFDLVINLKAAKALNLTVPDSVLARADKIIQ